MNSLFGLRSLNIKSLTSKIKAASYITTSFNSSDRGSKPQNHQGECWYCKSGTHRLINYQISVQDHFKFIKHSRLCHKCFSSRHCTPYAKSLILAQWKAVLVHFITHYYIQLEVDPWFSERQCLRSATQILMIYQKTLLFFLQFKSLHFRCKCVPLYCSS